MINYTRQAIDDARALLAEFVAHDWQELYVSSEDTEIFVARDGGGRNPMRAAPLPASVELPASVAPGTQVSLQAPHVGTVQELAAVGTSVAKGDRVAGLRVLDSVEDLEAPATGRIIRVDVSPGDLVEYRATILVVEEAA
ncbi:hypothetical protein [Sphingomonas sp. ID0503]|uniref:hypothetical protein n=1 Tax=Sphingomonas sp. ID0503 TaxID=3399691 RepID=UPI003AFB0BFA